jgi:hypothetical protein
VILNRIIPFPVTTLDLVKEWGPEEVVSREADVKDCVPDDKTVFKAVSSTSPITDLSKIITHLSFIIL